MAPNLIPESSNFEAGASGFQAIPLTFPQNGPRLIPPVLDDSTAAEGKRSWKLTNGSGEETLYVVSRPMRLPKEGEITISFSAKSEPPGVPIEASLCNGWKSVFSFETSISGDWQRFHTTANPIKWFFPENSGVKDVYYVKFVIPATAKWKSVWIDAVQVEYGGLSAYEDSRPFEMAFEMDREFKVYHPEETPGLTLHAAGPDVAGRKVQVVCEDLFAQSKEAAIEVVLKADGDNDHAKVQIPTTPRCRGSYRYTASIEGGGCNSTTGVWSDRIDERSSRLGTQVFRRQHRTHFEHTELAWTSHFQRPWGLCVGV